MRWERSMTFQRTSGGSGSFVVAGEEGSAEVKVDQRTCRTLHWTLQALILAATSDNTIAE
jgi:hypothetical protein